MEYAIKTLEEAEENIKELMNCSDGVSKEKLVKDLEDTQNAILVLNASQQIVNIGQVMALKRLQK